MAFLSATFTTTAALPATVFVFLLFGSIISIDAQFVYPTNGCRGYEECAGEEFGAYYASCYGDRGCALADVSSVASYCYGTEGCKGATMSANSGIRFLGYHSGYEADVLKTIYATCGGIGSCMLSTITQTQNSHAVQCQGEQSCSGATITGAGGINVQITGNLAGENANLYCLAGQTCYVYCNPKSNLVGTTGRATRIDPKCSSVTIYKSASATLNSYCDDTTNQCPVIIDTASDTELYSLMYENKRQMSAEYAQGKYAIVPEFDYPTADGCRDYNECARETFESRQVVSCSGSYACYYADITQCRAAECFGPYSCSYASLVTGRTVKLYGYESGRGSTMTLGSAECQGSLSCMLSTITQTSTRNPVECQGIQSCYGTIITGAAGINVQFTGGQSAYQAALYCVAGQTCDVYCNPITYVYGQVQNEYTVTDPKCSTVNIYKSTGATVNNYCVSGQCPTVTSVTSDEELYALMAENVAANKKQLVAEDEARAAAAAAEDEGGDNGGKKNKRRSSVAAGMRWLKRNQHPLFVGVVVFSVFFALVFLAKKYVFSNKGMKNGYDDTQYTPLLV